jgi:alcohol dehydrogenase (cytochrome c)
MRVVKRWMALCALLAAAATAPAQQAPESLHEPANPYSGDVAAIVNGKALFDSTCVACHGAGAIGTERAPSLRGPIVHGGSDFEVHETIRQGIAGTAMPAFGAFPADDLWRLVAYLRSLSGGTTPAGLPTQALGGDPGNGERLFFGAGGCAACHEISGRGALLAADLSAAGSRGPAALRNGVLHAGLPARRNGPFRLERLRLRDGRTLEGVVLGRDSFAITLQARAGSLAVLDRGQVIDAAPLPGTGMPVDVLQRLGSAAVEDLVAYLDQQRGRDFSALAAAALPPGLTAERISASGHEPGNWPTYWGDYRGHHFSELGDITRSKVHTLQARWAMSLPGASALETTPLVVDGIMYVSGPPGYVYALNARNGQQLWRYYRKQDIQNPYQINPYNRGVAVLGSRVFFGTLDNNLIALDARTGRLLWERRIGDTLTGRTMTAAPLALPGKIIVGISGGEFGANGFLEAYDPASGERLWHLDTIPGPGEPGHDTWPGDTWKTGGGPTWLTGSFDPQLNLLYWTTGNPGPDFDADVRKGDNLYTCSVLAIDPATGRLVWHYQFTPNDSHDWDAVQDVVLAERTIAGKRRHVLMQANRNGFFYVLDRVTGEWLSATPFVHQTWNAGFDAKGRPIVRPETVSTPGGVRVYPTTSATNFQAPSYDERRGVLYVAFRDAEGFASYAPEHHQPGKLFMATNGKLPPEPMRDPVFGIKALDVGSGRTLWTFPLTRAAAAPGVLGVRGGVLFAATAEGWFVALDSSTGKPLWKFNTGGPIIASPMSYAVDGEQFIALAAGNTVYGFALPK